MLVRNPSNGLPVAPVAHAERLRRPPVDRFGPGLDGRLVEGGVEDGPGDGGAVPGVGEASALGKRTRRPVGPTTSMSPTSRPAGIGMPRSASTWRPRGPTRSPHALSRGKVALSTNATRAPPVART